ncbi:SDR family NAD(P)-dependent oxidoreductase [Spongiibacter sp. KMU-158]|uniref:SDR family NAD(P)-dependent oxidoreductase n=1 Tax=Spongiibacter pelagi TaxID=2760804 RepID=A0A927GWX5_9GAMM|nr:SDR family NAD(P)-dependent oxidoreductase [Spongiibacter pelagi]MBD2859397.1 SDR family NAD(P)-dependent oxidoreductase [Spongiibacter pelagi]
MSARYIVITGAASGLGWALTKALFARGDNLLLIDRDATLLAERQQSLGVSQRITTAVADLGCAEGIAQALSRIHDSFDRVDVLINNAGITHRSLAGQTKPEVLRKVMTVDWQAPVELALGLLPKLRQSRGSIINLGSMAGWMPVLGRAGYCSAKSALGQFFEVLRAEERDNGLHVLMVYPAFVNTNIEQNALGGDGNAAQHARSTIGGISEAEPLAEKIIRALDKRKARLYPHRGIWLASLLWRLQPDIFQYLMRRKFAVELEQT